MPKCSHFQAGMQEAKMRKNRKISLGDSDSAEQYTILIGERCPRRGDSKLSFR